MLSDIKIKDIYPTIERYCKYLCKYTPRIDYKDLCSDVFLLLAENIDKMGKLTQEGDDLKRYAMKACKHRFINLVYYNRRRCKITNTLDPIVYEINGGRDSDDYHQFEMKDVIHRLNEVCNEKERELIRNISRGLKGEALYAKTGLKKTEIYRMKKDIRYKLSKVCTPR